MQYVTHAHRVFVFAQKEENEARSGRAAFDVGRREVLSEEGLSGQQGPGARSVQVIDAAVHPLRRRREHAQKPKPSLVVTIVAPGCYLPAPPPEEEGEAAARTWAAHPCQVR